MSRRALRPPSGQPPPERATAPGGARIALRPFAEEICRRYREEYPDEQERDGDAGVAWCVDDNQHILNWAFAAPTGMVDVGAQVRWLAGVLQARDFPLERLVRDLEIAAEVVAGDGVGAEVAAGLRRAAEDVGRKDV